VYIRTNITISVIVTIKEELGRICNI